MNRPEFRGLELCISNDFRSLFAQLFAISKRSACKRVTVRFRKSPRAYSISYALLSFEYPPVFGIDAEALYSFALQAAMIAAPKGPCLVSRNGPSALSNR